MPGYYKLQYSIDAGEYSGKCRQDKQVTEE